MIISTNEDHLADIMRDFKKYTNKQIIETIGRINESRKKWLLKSFSEAASPLRRISRYKVWQDGNHPKQIVSNKFLDQKMNYIHRNPVTDELVDEEEAYRYSSARDYSGRKGLLHVQLLN